MGYIQGHGQVPLFTSSLGSTSVAAGPWTQVHPKIRNITIQATMTGTTLGTSVSGTVQIEVSDDGVNPLVTKAGTISFGGSSIDTSPATDGFTIDAHWNYIRPKITALTTGIINVIASGMIQS